MKKLILFAAFISFFPLRNFAQFTLYSGNSAVEFSGYLTSYYNYRIYDKGATDLHKDQFVLDYAVFRMDGVVNKIWKYQVQLNNAAILNPDASDGFIMQADVAYNALKDNLNIDFGYNKLPFSRASMVGNTDAPFLQRAQMARGNTFNRRDLGTTVTYSLFNKLLNFYGGVYSGVGTSALIGTPDPSGKLEYIGRAEASYPARYRYTEIDLVHVPVPMVSIGVDGRYAEKDLTTGVDYPLLTVDGKKLAYSGDLSVAWNGFSTHLEFIQMKMTPKDTTTLMGKPTKYFMAGGIIAHANYYFSPIHSVFAVRYDEFNPNDLIIGDTQRTVSFGYNYLFYGSKAALKAQYSKRLKDKNALSVWNEDDVRLGFQLLF